MTTSYRAFLSTKVPAAKPAGIDVPLAAISESLFPFQRAIARWALYQALLMGRRFEGIELKPAYFEVACKHLAKAVREAASAKRTLFADEPGPARKRKATAVAEGGAA